MPYELSVSTRPHHHTESPADRNPALIPPDSRDSRPIPALLAGIGDIALADHSTGYPHLAALGAPTVGQLATFARETAATLSHPALWPNQRGHWIPAPHQVEHETSSQIWAAAVALEPNQFAAIPAMREDAAALHIASGQAHLLATTAEGEMTALQGLVVGHTRVLGTKREPKHWLLNTGTELAVAVRAIG